MTKPRQAEVYKIDLTSVFQCFSEKQFLFHQFLAWVKWISVESGTKKFMSQYITHYYSQMFNPKTPIGKYDSSYYNLFVIDQTARKADGTRLVRNSFKTW